MNFNLKIAIILHSVENSFLQRVRKILYIFVAVLTTDLSSSQSRKALLRWEMSSDSLNEDDSRLVTEIKKLLAS